MHNLKNYTDSREIYLDEKVFDIKSVLKASDKYSSKFNFHLIEKQDDKIKIIIESKVNSKNLDLFIAEFRREIIDQEIRNQVNKETKEIKVEIVKRAFSSITKNEV